MLVKVLGSLRETLRQEGHGAGPRESLGFPPSLSESEMQGGRERGIGQGTWGWVSLNKGAGGTAGGWLVNGWLDAGRAEGAAGSGLLITVPGIRKPHRMPVSADTAMHRYECGCRQSCRLPRYLLLPVEP